MILQKDFSSFKMHIFNWEISQLCTFTSLNSAQSCKGKHEAGKGSRGMLCELEKIGASKEEDADDLKGEEKSLNSREEKLKER